MPDLLTLTDAAAARCADLFAAHHARGLRVRVHSTGCEGFLAVLELAAELDVDEHEVVVNGVPIYLDQSSLPRLSGARLDFRHDGNTAEFVWKPACGGGSCGQASCPGAAH